MWFGDESDNDSDSSKSYYKTRCCRDDYKIPCHNVCLCIVYDKECSPECTQCNYNLFCIECDCYRDCEEVEGCECYSFIKCSNYIDEIEEAYNTIDTALSRATVLENKINAALTKETVCPPTPNPVEYPIAALFQEIITKT